MCNNPSRVVISLVFSSFLPSFVFVLFYICPHRLFSVVGQKKNKREFFIHWFSTHLCEIRTSIWTQTLSSHHMFNICHTRSSVKLNKHQIWVCVCLCETHTPIQISDKCCKNTFNHFHFYHFHSIDHMLWRTCCISCIMHSQQIKWTELTEVFTHQTDFGQQVPVTIRTLRCQSIRVIENGAHFVVSTSSWLTPPYIILEFISS